MREDRNVHADSQYVLASDPMILSHLAAGAPQPVVAFTGRIYRGYPFDDIGHAPVVVPAVHVAVERVVLYRSLVGAKPETHLAHFSFSTAYGDYLAHVVSRPPAFDQLLAAQGCTPPRGECVVLHFPAIPNTIGSRLRPGWTDKAVDPSGKEVDVRIVRQSTFDDRHLA
jgi:hypothetical protein